MMFNKVLGFIQSRTGCLYENSLFLQKIDWFILLFIILTFAASTVMGSDAIGFFALIVIFLTFVKLLTKPDERLSFRIFEIWLVAYFMIVVISLFGSTLFSLSLKGFFKTFVYLGFYFSVVRYLKSNRDKTIWLLAVIGLCTAGETAAGFMQSFWHPAAISTWQDTSHLNPEDVISRVYGTLKPLNPNLFGGYLIAGFPVFLGSTFYCGLKKNFKGIIFSLFMTFAGVYTIFQTGCRGAYLALMLIFGCVFIISAKFFWKTYKKLYISFLSAVILLFFWAVTFAGALRHRFMSIFAMRNDSSNSFRFNVYHSAIQMFKDNWLLGIGVGNKNFREIYGLYMKTGFDALSAYNIYLEIAVESGIFALAAFLGFLFTMIRNAVQYIWNSENIENVIFVSTALVSILAVCFHGFADTVFFRPQVQFVFWTFTAIISVNTETEK